MNKLLFFLSLCIITAGSTRAQITVTYNTPEAADSNVRIFSDPRLDLVVEKHTKIERGGIRTGRGYRVQIYYGSDRNEARARKLDFMRRYPEIQTYMSYVQPQYRVKVGNFASREDALDIYNQAIAIYGAAMIVPDIVTINTLEYDREHQK